MENSKRGSAPIWLFGLAELDLGATEREYIKHVQPYMYPYIYIYIYMVGSLLVWLENGLKWTIPPAHEYSVIFGFQFLFGSVQAEI